MALLGHAGMQMPSPSHIAGSMTALPFTSAMALRGQTLMHSPDPRHLLRSMIMFTVGLSMLYYNVPHVSN
jgi:hypothetical protein